MTLFDYKIQKITLVLLLITTAITFIYTLIFSTEIVNLSISSEYLEFFEIYDDRYAPGTYEIVLDINETYDEYLSVNSTIFTFSLISLILVGVLYLMGTYKRKKYTLSQNVATKVVPIIVMIIMIISMVLVINLKNKYNAIDFKSFNNLIVEVDNAEASIFPDNMVINPSTLFFDLGNPIFIVTIISSLSVLCASTIKYFKIKNSSKESLKNSKIGVNYDGY